jgi:hypothetical protein
MAGGVPLSEVRGRPGAGAAGSTAVAVQGVRSRHLSDGRYRAAPDPGLADSRAHRDRERSVHRAARVRPGGRGLRLRALVGAMRPSGRRCGEGVGSPHWTSSATGSSGKQRNMA